MTPRSNVQEAIDDLITEIFVRLTQELSGVGVEDPQESLYTTLCQVEEEWRAATQPKPGTELAGQSRETRIEAALSTLSGDERDALFLHLGRGMPCVEIARQTGVSRWAVLNDLVRAYGRLRLLLGDVDFRLIYRR